jgi:hypothetical protein
MKEEVPRNEVASILKWSLIGVVVSIATLALVFIFVVGVCSLAR